MWRAKAYAAGIDRATFSKQTISETMLAIEGLRWAQTMQAMPMLEYHLSKLSDKDLEDSAAKNKSTHPLRLELKRAMLEKFAPAFLMRELFGEGGNVRRVKPIEGMAREAALGIVESVEAGLLSDAAWNSIVKHYDAICLTAQREI